LNCGVDTTGVAISEGATGIAAITVSASGDNNIVVTSGANQHLTPQDVLTNLEMTGQAGLVLAQLEIPLETVEYLALLCARTDIPLILGPAPAAHLPPGILENVGWFTPNQTEANFFVDGEAASGRFSRRERHVAASNGARHSQSGFEDGRRSRLSMFAGWLFEDQYRPFP
jgi:ribokinase